LMWAYANRELACRNTYYRFQMSEFDWTLPFTTLKSVFGTRVLSTQDILKISGANDYVTSSASRKLPIYKSVWSRHVRSGIIFLRKPCPKIVLRLRKLLP
jgi:hypothetical protein